MKIFITILLSSFFFSIVSCKKKDTSAEMVAQLNLTDTFLYKFPKRNGAFDSLLYKNNMSYEKALKLQSLKKGFDSVQIRLYYGGPMSGERIVILTNRNNQWVAEISKFVTENNPKFKRDEIDRANADFWESHIAVRTSEYRTPKSGWRNFINQLFKLNILALPDQQNIDGFKEISVNDGVGICVQVATKNFYRLYYYDNPDMYLGKYSECKNISQIVRLIDQELSQKQLWDYLNQDTSTISKPVKFKEIKLEESKPEKRKTIKKR